MGKNNLTGYNMITSYKNNKALFMRQLFLMVIDALSAVVASIASLWVREVADSVFMDRAIEFAWLNVIIVIGVYLIFKLYNSMWGYAGTYEIQQIVFAVVTVTGVQFILMNLLKLKMPRSYWFLYMFFLGVCTCVSRLSYRYIRQMRMKIMHKKDDAERTMIVGAGSAADMMLREIFSSTHLAINPVCIADDNDALIGNTLRGVKICGKTSDIPRLVKEYDVKSIIIAMPSVSKRRVAEITSICNTTGCTIKTLPGLYQLVNDEVSVSKLRPVEIEDLLGRDEVKVNLEKINGYIHDKTVLVTGGGGSIGSELCRQIARAVPRRLIIVDIYENNAYDIEQELKWKCPELNLVVLIASVRDLGRMESIFEKYKPEIVFHAAAHKHVPLMENSPNEAIKNNVFGTYNMAKTADKYGAQKFILISTDKAVNPTNVMGASKRMCEMIVQAFSRRSATNFVAVRFGNVLGSNGSVIPLFKKQIKEGGPVKVTHPDIIRYFMTISEAVSLVLEAGAYAVGGEIYVLDMGEPVKIKDLAENLIRLSGFVPNEDIMIEYTGLRPGEKLYEERLMDEEGLKKTENDLISVAKPIEMDDDDFFKKLDKIYEDAYSETVDIRADIHKIVKTYNEN